MISPRPLAGSIDPVREAFDAARERPRLLALLSPTCPACSAGARAVRSTVATLGAAAGIVVWTPVLAGDAADAARRQTGAFPPAGIEAFYDPERAVGHAVADALGGTGDVAWDVYLVYGPGTRWSDPAPRPADWMHQLRRCSWAPRERYRCGEDELATALRASVEKRGDGNPGAQTGSPNA